MSEGRRFGILLPVMNDTAAEKGTIRAAMRARRRAVSAAARAAASAAVCHAIWTRADVRAAVAARRPVAAYCATAEEIDLTALFETLWDAGAVVAVPRWEADARAYGLAVCARGAPLESGRMGILEPAADARRVAPAAVGAWIVPGLAFTRDGARLGYGGGWYDRFLAAAAPDAATLGVAYPFQRVDALPEDPHDRRLTAVIFADMETETA